MSNSPKKRRVSRRAFLAVLFGGAGALAVARWRLGGLGIRKSIYRLGQKYDAWRHAGADIEQELYRHFDYLTLDPEGVKRFAEDYTAAFGPTKNAADVEDVHTRYLMSTTFFRAGADESQTLRYIMLYDPGSSPCFNPFATFDEEAA